MSDVPETLEELQSMSMHERNHISVDAGRLPRKHKPPSKSELLELQEPDDPEGAVKQTRVSEEYDVSNTTALRWLRERGLYEPSRCQAGCSSELGRRLLELDADEIGDGDS